jgi:hypothetical protein
VNTRIVVATTISDAVKDILRRQIKSGWTAERIGYEMQKLGNAWSASTANNLTRQGTRPLTVDEAVGLLAVFSSRNRIIARELERQITRLTGEATGHD